MADQGFKEEPMEKNTDTSAKGHVQRLHRERTTGMENSVLTFKNINFSVGKKDKEKKILEDVSGVIKFGRVLAIMGPSGAGKTVLLNALTLDATFGKTAGSCKLNGVPITKKIFEEHCYVVKQRDMHWPYLTTFETLKFACQLGEVVAKEDEDRLVGEIITKMGLDVCKDTKAASLSGGQRRRLSMALALVKQPRILFLDEPTTGLDSASAFAIVQEIVRISREEGLITLCTIHQPSSKVYSIFDQVMIMSRGRTAFTGEVGEATPYFANIGYPIPDETNPAEYFMDLVNSDFSDETQVIKILDLWEENGAGATASHHSHHDDDKEGVVNEFKKSRRTEITTLLRRHFLLILRDPVLYVGRAFVMLIANCIFALVYLSARDNTQDQAINKFWLTAWFIVIPCQFGCVAAYGLNEEFKTLMLECKNGVVSGVSYVLAKTVLVLPLMLIFGVFALGVPFYGIADAPIESFFHCIVLFACAIYIHESVAECISAWFDDVIIGMLQFMNYWFAGFLFGGFLIPLEDLYWPFEAFYYVWPYSYYLRAFNYQYFKYLTFESCNRLENPQAAVCVDSTDGLDVLRGLEVVFPVLTTADTFAQDVGVLIAIGTFFKLLYVCGAVYKTSRSSSIEQA